MNEEQLMKDNLIRLITSRDITNLGLAIQLNKGVKLLEWEEIYSIIDAMGEADKGMGIKESIERYHEIKNLKESISPISPYMFPSDVGTALHTFIDSMLYVIC
jgi:hypothetical protein